MGKKENPHNDCLHRIDSFKNKVYFRMKLQQDATGCNSVRLLVPIQQNTWCHMPEDRNLNIHPKCCFSWVCLVFLVNSGIVTTTLQTVTYSAFMMIFLFHGTLHNKCEWSFPLFCLTNTELILKTCHDSSLPCQSLSIIFLTSDTI
jgi:hypothetical protein